MPPKTTPRVPYQGQILRRSGKSTIYDCGCTGEADEQGTVYIVHCSSHTKLRPIPTRPRRPKGA